MAAWATVAVIASVAVGFVVSRAGNGDTYRLPNSVPQLTAPGDADPGGDEGAPVRLPPRGGRLFGFSGDIFKHTGSGDRFDIGVTADAAVKDALAVGANAARIQIAWWDLEPQQGVIDEAFVARMKGFTDPFERAGGKIVIVLGGTPGWAAADPGSQASGPRDDRATTTAFARYAANVARTWPHAVAIETWNEENASFFWGPSPDPSQYTRFHKAAARAIRKEAPGVRVLVGGLAGTDRDVAGMMRPQRFLKGMYAAGLEPSDYDGLAIHPYPPQNDGEVGPLDSGGFAAIWQDFRLGYGWRHPRAAVWVTETGVTTTGRGAGVDARTQAETLVRLTRKLLTMPRVRGVFLHTEYDTPAFSRASRERGFGVLATPGRPKPAFCALRALVRDPTPGAC